MYFSKISLISLQEPIFSPLLIFFEGNLLIEKKKMLAIHSKCCLDRIIFSRIFPLNTTLQSLLLRRTKVVLNFSRFQPRGPQLKPVFGGFETQLKFIEFVHRPH